MWVDVYICIHTRKGQKSTLGVVLQESLWVFCLFLSQGFLLEPRVPYPAMLADQKALGILLFLPSWDCNYKQAPPCLLVWKGLY